MNETWFSELMMIELICSGDFNLSRSIIEYSYDFQKIL